MTTTLKRHWVCIVPLLPAVAMIAIHEGCGLSDEMMGHLVGAREPTAFETYFNLAMGAVFYLGVAGFLWHAILLAKVTRFWLTIKLSALAGCWGLLLLYFALK